MKRNMTRKFTLALSSFMVAAVALTSATFAWFTQAGNARVDDFNMSVSAAPGLKIGLKLTAGTLAEYGTGTKPNGDAYVAGDIVYFTSLTTDIVSDFFGAPNTNLLPVTAKDTQTVNTIQTAYPEMLTLNYLAATPETPVATTSGYYQMEFFLYSQKASVVSLKDSTEGVNVFSTVEANDNNQDDVINALRVGFGDSSDGSFDIFAMTDTTTDLWGPLDLDGDGYYDGVEVSDNSINGTDNGFREYVYGESVNPGTYETGHADSGPAVSAFDAARLGTTYVATAAVGQTQTSASTGFDWTLTAETNYRLTVTIWLEGWDTDTVNEVGLSSFVTSLQFSSVAA